jgi:hypothetical protein
MQWEKENGQPDAVILRSTIHTMGKRKWPTRHRNSKKHKPYNGKKKMANQTP